MRPPLHWLAHLAGLAAADTQLTPAERLCLARHAAGRRRAVEIGVYHGAGTRLLRSAMAPDGHLTGIDPHPIGRFGVSFERMIAGREVQRSRGATVTFERGLGGDVGRAWTGPALDLLFIDGDHSWAGIDDDWRAWRPHVGVGGLVALHDSRPVPGRPDLDSVRYTQEVIAADTAFRQVDAVDSLTVLERVRNA